jgi:hypothetical protein
MKSFKLIYFLIAFVCILGGFWIYTSISTPVIIGSFDTYYRSSIDGKFYKLNEIEPIKFDGNGNMEKMYHDVTGFGGDNSPLVKRTGTYTFEDDDDIILKWDGYESFKVEIHRNEQGDIYELYTPGVNESMYVKVQ